MKESGARTVVRALEDEGIRLAFGIPGTHNIELYDALAESDRVRAVLVTDEQSASFMADGAWRASGRMACVNIVPGAGLTHALSGVAEAYMDTVPMLVLGCGIRRDIDKAYQLHDVDQLAIARPITKAAVRPERPENVYRVIRDACRLARTGAPGPVFVEIPANVYLFRHESDGAAPATSSGMAPLPAPDAVAKAAALLNRARRPLLYLGLGALGAVDSLVALAEHLEAPVATTFQGKGVLPESHPLALWPGFGAAAPPFAREIARSCDATLAIGCRFGEVGTAGYGVDPPRPLIHVDIDERVVGRNFPADVGVAADAAEFVRALLPQLTRHPEDPTLRGSIALGRAAVQTEWREHSSDRVSPFALIEALQSRFGERSIYVTDSGNGTFLAMEQLVLDSPRHFLAPVDYSCMGYAVPAAIGAKLAMPDAPVIALAGDGAFLMTGLELLTAANQHAAVAVLVLRDRELAQIAQFQTVAMNRKTNSVLPDYDLCAIATGVGVECLTMAQDAEIAPVLERVAAITGGGRPVVVDVAIDYSERTFFTRGVVKTTFGRLPWVDRLRFLGRALARRLG